MKKALIIIILVLVGCTAEVREDVGRALKTAGDVVKDLPFPWAQIAGWITGGVGTILIGAGIHRKVRPVKTKPIDLKHIPDNHPGK